MFLGEVGLLTRDVNRLAAFYRELLGVEAAGDPGDEWHQTIITEGVALTVTRADVADGAQGQRMCLAFTLDDIRLGYEHVRGMGARINEPPTQRPWGAVNMSFYDPDGNLVYLRQFSE